VKLAELAELPARYPDEAWFVDFSGPWNQGDYVFGVIDRFSHFVWLKHVNDTTTETAAKSLWDIITSIGTMPVFVTSDGGKSFIGQEFQEMCKILTTRHHVSMPLHPEGHAPIERIFRDMNNLVRSLVAQDRWTWNDLQLVSFALNTSFSRAVGTTPFEARHGYAPRIVVQSLLQAEEMELGEGEENDTRSFAEKVAQRWKEIAPQIQQRMERIHKENARIWRLESQGKQKFHKGSYVLVYRPREGKEELEWHGPYVVIKRVEDENNVYEIDGWVKLADCHWSPAIKAYIKQHHLQADVRSRKRQLGPLPRS